MGTREGALQWTPSDETIMTMSFSAQLLRKRQSCQATYTLPALSTAADGSDSVRKLPLTKCSSIDDATTVLLQLPPPFVEVKERTLPSKASSIGTTTVPFGRTTGWPPIPLAKSAVLRTGPHVAPPSDVVTMLMISPLPASSNST